jgi:CrcB protein
VELTLKAVVLVSMGGVIGAPLRYTLSVLITRSLGSPGFPVATLCVNVAGSFLLGLLTWTAAGRFGLTSNLRILLGIGMLGAFTTYSTFSIETLLLIERDRPLAAALYVLLTASLCIGAAAAGMQAAKSYF